MNDYRTKSISYTLVVTGDEILSGRRKDQHIPLINSALIQRGMVCMRCVIVGDNDSSLTAVLKQALQESTVVIVTGGLGPTLDDITRESLSDATGIPLHESPGALAELHERFRQIGRPMSENNRRQALVPEKGLYFSNPHGTAPGLVYDLGDRIAIALPGPPRELEPMLNDCLIPFLLERFQLHQTRLSASMRFCCIGESNLDALVRERFLSFPSLIVSSISHLGTVDLTFSLPAHEPDSKERLCFCLETMKQILSDYIYSFSNESLAEVVEALLRNRRETLSVAESCTGGLLGAQLTSIPGSSDVFLGGIIAYQNRIKHSLLHVETQTLSRHGAVSQETACQMAKGVLQVMNSTWGIGITGIAGPGGGSKEKPAGTVCIAVANEAEAVRSFQIKLFGSREAVRQRSCVYALDQLRRELLNLPLHSG